MYNYTNAVIDPTKTSPIGTYVALSGMEQVAQYCHDINPCLSSRPIRDGGWIRTQWSQLKGKLTIVFNNYHKSGYQEAENIYDEWVRFAQPYGDAFIYARALFGENEMEQLGRAIHSDIARDTGFY
jgi:hypothetical protein